MESSRVCGVMKLSLVALVLMAGCKADFEVVPSPEGEGTADIESAAPADPVPATRIDISGTVAGMWWNEKDLFRSLDLSRSQREQMDQLLADYLEPWMEMQQRRRRAPKQLMAAYREGDIERARELSAGLGEAAAYLDGGVAILKVEVLALLDEEQLRLLVENHEHLLRRKWVVPGRVSPEGGGGPGRPGGGPAAARQRAE